VVGRDFPRALLSALVDLEDAVLERELAALVEAGLLQVEPGAERGPGFQFRHALIQDAAYQSLSRSTRRQHHQRIARILEERFAHLVTTKPEMLAHHYTQAGEVEPAVHNWLRAGLLANQRWALQDAMRHLTLALELLSGLPEARRRLPMELRILSALSMPVAHLRGYGSPELARMLSRLRELFSQVGDELPRTDLWCWGIFAYAYARADLPLALSLVEMLMAQGARHDNQELLSVGHRQMGHVLLLQGRLQGAMEQLGWAMRCADLHLTAHRRPATPQWTDPKATALSLADVIHTVAGRIDEARVFGRSALELAGRLHHVDTTAYALMFMSLSCQLRREPGEALRWAEQARALACEHSYWLWRSWSTMVQGWALSELGQHHEGLAIVEQEIRIRREQGILVGVPHNYGILAAIHLKLGHLGEGLDATREALSEVKARGECFYEAELHRLYGELLRVEGKECEAMPRFLRAIAVARHQGAGLFELRATVALGRLLRDQGRQKEAVRFLVRACARAEAGGESVDLQEARALLRALQVGGPGLALLPP
jgi:tetratricopeptide (TPR) repeat protein